jgi:hypothetical protein
MQHKGIIIAASIIVVLSFVYIFLKTTSITGYVTYRAPLCENQNDCSPNEACCLFAGDVAGVCYTPESCDEIAGMTAREYEEYLNAGALEMPEEEEQTTDYQTTIAATVVLVLALLVIIYFVALEEKSKQKSFFS